MTDLELKEVLLSILEALNNTVFFEQDRERCKRKRDNLVRALEIVKAIKEGE